MKLVVLASGRGSNFQAIADAIRAGTLAQTEIAGLVCSRADAGALAIAKERKIPTFLHASKAYYKDKRLDRDAYEAKLLQIVRGLAPNYVCLAGYTLLLGPALLNAFPDRILNIHPSLLPAFKGLHAQRQALEYGARWTGCTVHLATASLDDGPILAQTAISILPEDTEESLSQRLLEVEHKTYVEVLQKLATRPHRLVGRNWIWG